MTTCTTITWPDCVPFPDSPECEQHLFLLPVQFSPAKTSCPALPPVDLLRTYANPFCLHYVSMFFVCTPSQALHGLLPTSRITLALGEEDC